MEQECVEKADCENLGVPVVKHEALGRRNLRCREASHTSSTRFQYQATTGRIRARTLMPHNSTFPLFMLGVSC